MTYPVTNQVEHNAGLGMGTSVAYAPYRKFVSLPNGGIRISNREIIGVVGGTATTGTIPGSSSSAQVSVRPPTGSNGFTWLGAMEGLYDKYQFQKLRMEWEPLMPTTTSGGLVMHFDSDQMDASAAHSYVGLAGNYLAVSTPIWSKIGRDVPAAMLKHQKMFRTGMPDTTPDGTNGFYSTGQITWATTDISLANTETSGTVTLGYIWCDYVVDLYFPSSQNAGRRI